MKKIIIVLLGVLVFALPTVNKAYAGSLNEYELEIIEAAKQEYEYSGAYYRAEDCYIDKLVEYFSQDDIDITKEDKDNILQWAYENIEKGVREGYLKPVGTYDGQDDSDTLIETQSGKNNPDAISQIGNSNSDKKSHIDSHAKIQTGKTSQQYTDREEQIGESIQHTIGKIINKNQNTEEKNSFLTDENKTDRLKISDSDAGLDSYNINAFDLTETYTDIDKDKGNINIKIYNIYNILYFIIGLVIFVFVLCIAHCFFKKGAYRKSGGDLKMHTDFNTENLFSYFYAFLLAFVILVLNISIGLGLGLFSSQSIIKSINKGNYFEKTYEDIIANTEKILSQAGFPETLLSEVISRDKLHISGMNYVEDVLNNREPELEHDISAEISNKLMEYINEAGIAETPDLSEKVANVAAAVETEYADGIKMRIIDYLTECKQKYNRAIKIILPCIIVLMAIICYLLLKIQRYKHRGVRYISYALLASSISTIVIALYTLWRNNGSNVMANADYYYEMASQYLKVNYKGLVLLGLIGFCAAIVSFKVVDLMKKKIVRA